MGYYMRFFDTTDQPLPLATLDAALKQFDSAYRIQINAKATRPQGTLHHGDALYGEIEINQPGDGLFDEELQEHLEALADADEDERTEVEQTLRTARRSIVVRVLWQGRDVEPTLVRIDPLWEWLFENRTGLLQADGEGYYDEDGLILSVE